MIRSLLNSHMENTTILAYTNGLAAGSFLVMGRADAGRSRLPGILGGSIGVGWSAWSSVRLRVWARGRPSLQVVYCDGTPYPERRDRTSFFPLSAHLDRILFAGCS